MEPFLERLKEKAIKKYGDNVSVLFYPTRKGRNDMAFFQIKNKRARTFYFKWENDRLEETSYTFAGTPLKEHHFCSADRFEVKVANDTPEGRFLKACFFNNLYNNYSKYWFEDYLKQSLSIYRKYPKLVTELVDYGIISSFRDANYVSAEQDGSVKEVYGVPAKYIRATKITSVGCARKCWNLGFSVEETVKVINKLGSYSIMHDYYNARTLRYATNAKCGYIWLYSDYLSMRKYVKEHGVDVSSFPECPADSTDEHIRKLHDDITRIQNRVRQLERVKEMQEKNKNYAEQYYPKALEFAYENDKYSIKPCVKLEDLVNEGSELRHCVGSYIESVAEGREYILFLRKKEEPDKPYFTVDVLPDKTVRQIHGMCNCNVPDELMPFIKKWAKEYELNIDGINGVRGHV